VCAIPLRLHLEGRGDWRSRSRFCIALKEREEDRGAQGGGAAAAEAGGEAGGAAVAVAVCLGFLEEEEV